MVLEHAKYALFNRNRVLTTWKMVLAEDVQTQAAFKATEFAAENRSWFLFITIKSEMQIKKEFFDNMAHKFIDQHQLRKMVERKASRTKQ